MDGSGRRARATSRFGIGLATTSSFVPFVVAAVASLRRHNVDVPVTVYVDQPDPELLRVAPILDMTVDAGPASTQEAYDRDGSEREWTASRLVKIQSLLRMEHEPYLYLDADTIVVGDIAEIQDELADRLGAETDLFMLLRRPTAPTLWGHRHLYFLDLDLDRETAARLISEAFGLVVPASFLDEETCWNSGVIYGSARAMRVVATRWLELYRRMLRAPAGRRLIPRDQLSLWIALWELRGTIRVDELPPRWNFMAGHLLGVDPGSADIDPGAIGDARVLHLAQNKFDPWALRRVREALEGLGVDPPRTQDLRRGLDAPGLDLAADRRSAAQTGRS